MYCKHLGYFFTHTIIKVYESIFQFSSDVSSSPKPTVHTVERTCSEEQAHREGRNRDTSPGPPNFFLERGPTRLLTFLCYIFLFFFRFLLHCLDSMSERLGGIINNTFTVSIDKYFDACKHAENQHGID